MLHVWTEVTRAGRRRATSGLARVAASLAAVVKEKLDSDALPTLLSRGNGESGDRETRFLRTVVRSGACAFSELCSLAQRTVPLPLPANGPVPGTCCKSSAVCHAVPWGRCLSWGDAAPDGRTAQLARRRCWANGQRDLISVWLTGDLATPSLSPIGSRRTGRLMFPHGRS